MYSKELTDRLISLIAPDGYTERTESEAKYPLRDLAEGAEVMRVPPSPTGFVHIGTIYAGLINERIAHQSNGKFILRIEDTDKKREVEGSVDQIIDAFDAFEIPYDEGPDKPSGYGPYFQSKRAKIYLGFVVDLLKKGRAYPCFASPEELEAAVKDQQTKKLRPGYYGEWALWRNKTEEEITEALNATKPFVLRFRSEGSHDKRVDVKDRLKGLVELPQNDLDVPLIKSDEHRLPTYHLAHVVDDYLMRTTLVLRGDEWLPSTPLHMEISLALGIKPFKYAHLAPISIIGKEGGKRKLSKRKDDEADVKFWLDAGYPVEGIKAYLLGLANSNFEEWYRNNPNQSLNDYPFSIQKLAASRAPLLDNTKLEDYCKDYIARLPQAEFEERLINAQSEKFRQALESDRSGYTHKILIIERDGDKPRKDLSQWGQAFDQYAYFYDDLFEENFKDQGRHEYLSDFDDDTLKGIRKTYYTNYFSIDDDQQTWFEKLKQASETCGFATDNKSYKASPENYKGSVADFARIIRVSLTGKNRTPDLWTIMQVMGEKRVLARLSV